MRFELNTYDASQEQVSKSGGCHFVADMVCAFAFPAFSACEKWDDSCSAGACSAGDVWVHSCHVVSDDVAAPLVLLDFRCDCLSRYASYAGVSHASHFTLAPRGSYRRFDSFLCADGSSILFVDSMKPWPNTSLERTPIKLVACALAGALAMHTTALRGGEVAVLVTKVDDGDIKHVQDGIHEDGNLTLLHDSSILLTEEDPNRPVKIVVDRTRYFQTMYGAGRR
jgi:hypothetical protein